MHAAFLLPNMGAGGAERLTIDLMAGFVSRGARVDLVLMERSGEFLQLVPPGVRVIELGATRLRGAIFPLRNYLKEERPEALLAAMWPLTSVAQLAALGLHNAPRVVLAEHCSLLEQYEGRSLILAGLRLGLRGYRKADAVVAVSDGLGREIAALAGLREDRVITIHNPIDAPLSSGKRPWDGLAGTRILAVGKLKPQKNFSLLIDAFALLVHRIDATLVIVGEGVLRPQLEAKVDRLGLKDRVLLPGFSLTPGDWYDGADLFVLSSDYEGFGNVLVEAMHCGLPIVATDCRHGPAELLDHGRWGRLTPPGDAASLAEAIAAELDFQRDPGGQRSRAAQFGTERAVDAYWRELAK